MNIKMNELKTNIMISLYLLTSALKGTPACDRSDLSSTELIVHIPRWKTDRIHAIILGEIKGLRHPEQGDVVVILVAIEEIVLGMGEDSRSATNLGDIGFRCEAVGADSELKDVRRAEVTRVPGRQRNDKDDDDDDDDDDEDDDAND